MAGSVYAAYFSPTGSTKTVTKRIAAGFGGVAEEIDLSKPLAPRAFAPGDIVVVGVPVFVGRMIATSPEAVKNLAGNGAVAVAAVVYGNRGVDDALAELYDLLVAQGFQVAAAGSFPAQHSLVEGIATGRPDAQDLAEIDTFAQKALGAMEAGAFGPIAVPGDRPYKEYKMGPVAPSANEDCTFCGLCADECPTRAISYDALRETDQTKCIVCMRCCVVCPVNARSLPDAFTGPTGERLRAACAERKPNVFYFA